MLDEFFILSSNDKTKLSVKVWQPSSPARAILQISHGMKEYVLRYDAFARFMNDNGIIVVGNDHLGHGNTAVREDDFGYFGPGKSETVVKDLHKVTEFISSKCDNNLPIFLFGHSMGSLMARRYLSEYGENLYGAIICGTTETPPNILQNLKTVIDSIEHAEGPHFRPEALKNMLFGHNNDRIKECRTENDWHSSDSRTVAAYNADPLCNFDFTVNGYQTLHEVSEYVRKMQNILCIPSILPILFIAGKADPVGDYGNAVLRVYRKYQRAGLIDIALKLYNGARHELLQETNKLEVYDDVLHWINRKLTRP